MESRWAQAGLGRPLSGALRLVLEVGLKAALCIVLGGERGVRDGLCPLTAPAPRPDTLCQRKGDVQGIPRASPTQGRAPSTALPAPRGSTHQVPELDGGDLRLHNGPQAPEEVGGQSEPDGEQLSALPGPLVPAPHQWRAGGRGTRTVLGVLPSLSSGGPGDMPPGRTPWPQGLPSTPTCPSPTDLREHLLLDAGLLLVCGVPASPRVLREVMPDEMQLEEGQSRLGRCCRHCPGTARSGTPPVRHTPTRSTRCQGTGQLYLLLPAGVVLWGSLEEGPGIVGVVVNPFAEVVADVEAPGETGG